MKDFSKLQKKLGIRFKDEELLKTSLVHRSYINENPKFSLSHNERLEFLGDAVLELIVTKYLFDKFPQKREGELTSLRSSLVNSKELSMLAQKLNLDCFLYLSKGEAKDTGRAREQILANAFEALIGVIYLDQGYKVAKSFIEKKLLKNLPKILKQKLYIDPKSRFQEIAQEKIGVTPEYKVLKEEGPDHARIFEVGVYLDDTLVARGEGPSKQEAQVEAAKNALEKMEWEQS